MTLEQKIASIIEDCCAVDPSLHDREAELRLIVRSLLEAQPDTKFDAAFAKRLRQAVLDQAAGAKLRKPSFMERLRHASRQDVLVLGSAALGLVLAVTLSTQSLLTPKQRVGDVQLGLAPRPGIAMLADGAFGSLTSAAAPSAPMASDAGRGSASPVPSMESAVGIAPAPSSPVPPQAGGGANKMVVAPDMMPYTPIAYRFVFKGQLGALEPKVSVYRRVKGFAQGDVPIAALDKIAAGTLDLSRLENAAIQTFSLIEDRDFGYSVFVDTNEGTVSFGQFWQRWPHPESACQDEECYRRYQLTPSQIPANDALTAVADRFLGNYGVARDGFGVPEVQNAQLAQAIRASGEGQVFIPDSVPVVYPSVLDGLVVNDDSGAAAGLVVNVNIRHMRVDNVWGLMSNVYQRSSYEAETDAARLIAFAEKGGTWGGWTDPSAKTVEVELGEPSIVLIRNWKYRDDGTNDELLVPALRFPVMNPPVEDPWFRKAVMVPLAKELLDSSAAPQPMPMPAVMLK